MVEAAVNIHRKNLSLSEAMFLNLFFFLYIITPLNRLFGHFIF